MGKRHEGLPEDDFVIRRKKPKVNTKKRREKGWKKQGDGLPPDPVLMVDSEPIPEPEIKVETPEAKPNPAPKLEKKEVKAEEGEKVQGGGLELKRYEDFKNEISSLQTKDDLLSYLASAEKFKLSYEDDSIAKSVYFPAYVKEVEKVFAGISPTETLNEVPVLYEKVGEIMRKGRGEDIKLIKDKKSSRGKRNPTQRDADIFASKPETYGRNKYANGSVPEDAKEEMQRVENAKLLKVEEAKKIKKEKEASIEKYFSAMKDYEPETKEDVPLKKWEEVENERKRQADKTIAEEELGEIKRETEEMKLEIEELRAAYKKKKNENRGFLEKFKSVFSGSLGESAKEEEGLRLKLLVKESEVEENLEKIKKLEEKSGVAEEDVKEKTMGEEKEELEKEISAISEKEREKMGIGLKNLGFYVEEYKNKFFAKTVEKAASLVSDKNKNIAEQGTFARFLSSLGENFRKDAEKARINIGKTNKGESKKLANASYLSGNILRYGRIAADFTKWTVASPLRYWMMGAMAVSRGFEAMKEARMKNENVIDKTRIHDIEKAAEEAWKIYNEAKAGENSVSKEDLEKAYQRNIPEDLLRRLNQNSREVVRGSLVQGIIRYDVRKLTEKINNKLEIIDGNKNLSNQEKEIQKEKIFAKYSDYIKSFDRIVSQAGTVDALAMGAQYLKTGSKAVVYGVTAETLAVLTQKVFENTPHILGEVEKIIHQSSEKSGGHSISFLDNTEISQEGHPLHGPYGETPGGNIETGAPSSEAVLEKPIGLKVEQDGSLEKTLVAHFEEGGMDHDAAGREAHLRMLEYAEKEGIPFEKLNHVLPGQEIELNPDGTVKNIPGFESAPADISDKPEPEIKTVSDDVREPEIETVPNNVAEPAPENLPNPVDSHFGRNVSYILDDLNEHINENTSELLRPETHDAEELAAFREKIADLGYSKGFLENFRDHVFQGNAGEATKSFRSAIALDEKWDNIKGMNFREAAKNMNWRASDKLDTIFKCLKETLGNDARPGGGETLEKWTERVSRLAVEKTK